VNCTVLQTCGVSYREKLLIDLHAAGLRHIKVINSLFLFLIKTVISVVLVHPLRVFRS